MLGVVVSRRPFTIFVPPLLPADAVLAVASNGELLQIRAGVSFVLKFTVQACA